MTDYFKFIFCASYYYTMRVERSLNYLAIYDESENESKVKIKKPSSQVAFSLFSSPSEEKELT